MKEEIKIIKDLLELVEELYQTGDNSHWKLEEEETVINADKYLLKKGLGNEYKVKLFEITKETRWDELMFNSVISCRLCNVMRANINYEGYDPKVKDLYPISMKEVRSFRNVGKKTAEEFASLYELLDIEILN